jgi:hypothetical protein
MDALIAAAQQRQRPRDIAIFLIMRYTGMRRESVATLQSDTSDGTRARGARQRRTDADIPLPEV